MNGSSVVLKSHLVCRHCVHCCSQCVPYAHFGYCRPSSIAQQHWIDLIVVLQYYDNAYLSVRWESTFVVIVVLAILLDATPHDRALPSTLARSSEDLLKKFTAPRSFARRAFQAFFNFNAIDTFSGSAEHSDDGCAIFCRFTPREYRPQTAKSVRSSEEVRRRVISQRWLRAAWLCDRKHKHSW